MCITRFERTDKDNLTVPTCYQDNNKGILQCFLKSVLEVKKGYIFYHNDKEEFLQTERVFAYEFYRQWACKVEEKYHGEYIINGEPEKSLGSFRNNKYKFPDLIMHHNQGDGHYQGIVCEIKRKKGFTKLNFRNDIEKLCFFVDEFEYKFEYGVFVLAGTDMGQILTHISSILKSPLTFKKDDNSFKKIICVTYDGEKMETILFSQIINMSESRREELIRQYNTV